MTEHHQNHPFVHCDAPMLLAERARHPRIPLHEVRTFTCSVCNANMMVTAPILAPKQNGSSA